MRLSSSIRARAAQALEEGRLQGALARALSSAWAKAADARLVKSLDWPPHVRAIGVGGGTLGGSYKTPLALAVAHHFASSGRNRVAIVGHGYGARVERARAVVRTDEAREVGDEAVWLAEKFTRGLVVVGPERSDAVRYAVAQGANVIVFDGLHQTTPRRLDHALLVLDAERPWGASQSPPSGDARGSAARLRSLADEVVLVRTRRGGAERHADDRDRDHDHDQKAHEGRYLLEGARLLGGAERLSMAELRGKRLGLSTAIARPSRLVGMLLDEGIVPTRVVRSADHAGPAFPPVLEGERPPVDGWLVTEKCASWLRAEQPESYKRLQVPVFVLEAALAVPTLLRKLEAASDLDQHRGAP